MFVGVARLLIEIPEAGSLKDKRRVVKGFKDRMRARLPISIAEVGEPDRHTLATLGVVTVSSAAKRCHETLNAATRMAETLGDASLVEVTTEVVPFGTDGRSVGTTWPQGTLSGGPADDEPLPWEDET